MSFSEKGVIAVLLVIIVYLTYSFFTSLPSCEVIKSIDASLTVKEIEKRLFIGLNADTQNLSFGATSPGGQIRRSVFISAKTEKRVTVHMEGDLASWMSITPQEFSLTPEARQQVFFEVQVPLLTPDGDYQGKAVFCFEER